jgi:hypothetical protein
MPYSFTTSSLSHSSWVASVTNKDSQGSTNDGPAYFMQLSVPNDSPAKQGHVPNDDNPAIATSSFLQLLHVPTIATFIWHQAFDNSLSHHMTMNITNTTSVSALNGLLTSSYLHTANGMMAHIYATPTSLLLFHVKDGQLVTITTHAPNLLLISTQECSAIMTATHTDFSLQLIVESFSDLLLPPIQDDTAIMQATHANCSLQLIDELSLMGALHIA